MDRSTRFRLVRKEYRPLLEEMVRVKKSAWSLPSVKILVGCVATELKKSCRTLRMPIANDHLEKLKASMLQALAVSENRPAINRNSVFRKWHSVVDEISNLLLSDGKPGAFQLRRLDLLGSKLNDSQSVIDAIERIKQEPRELLLFATKIIEPLAAKQLLKILEIEPGNPVVKRCGCGALFLSLSARREAKKCSDKCRAKAQRFFRETKEDRREYAKINRHKYKNRQYGKSKPKKEKMGAPNGHVSELLSGNIKITTKS